MSTVASLGMYDFPWLHAENDALWAVLRRRLGSQAPVALDRARELRTIWRDPDLLLGQTCGYPLMTELARTVRVVGTPVYGFAGCDGPRHRSFIVVRADDPATDLADLRGRTAAINGWDSNSGMNLLRAAVAPLATGGCFFSEVIVTGAHLQSLAAVRGRAADAASIDCVTYGLAARYCPDLLAGTRVIAPTQAILGLPLITAKGTSDVLLDALRDGFDRILPWAGLGILSLARTSVLDYAPILALERQAVGLGYPRLA